LHFFPHIPFGLGAAKQGLKPNSLPPSRENSLTRDRSDRSDRSENNASFAKDKPTLELFDLPTPSEKSSSAPTGRSSASRPSADSKLSNAASASEASSKSSSGPTTSSTEGQGQRGQSSLPAPPPMLLSFPDLENVQSLAKTINSALMFGSFTPLISSNPTTYFFETPLHAKRAAEILIDNLPRPKDVSKFVYVLGFDVKTAQNPDSNVEGKQVPSLLQIGIGDSCVLIFSIDRLMQWDAMRMDGEEGKYRGVPESLKVLLETPWIIKTGLNADGHASTFHELGIFPRGIIDLNIPAAAVGLNKVSFKSLAENYWPTHKFRFNDAGYIWTGGVFDITEPGLRFAAECGITGGMCFLTIIRRGVKFRVEKEEQSPDAIKDPSLIEYEGNPRQENVAMLNGKKVPKSPAKDSTEYAGIQFLKLVDMVRGKNGSYDIMHYLRGPTNVKSQQQQSSSNESTASTPITNAAGAKGSLPSESNNNNNNQRRESMKNNDRAGVSPSTQQSAASKRRDDMIQQQKQERTTKSNSNRYEEDHDDNDDGDLPGPTSRRRENAKRQMDYDEHDETPVPRQRRDNNNTNTTKNRGALPPMDDDHDDIITPTGRHRGEERRRGPPTYNDDRDQDILPVPRRREEPQRKPMNSKSRYEEEDQDRYMDEDYDEQDYEQRQQRQRQKPGRRGEEEYDEEEEEYLPSGRRDGRDNNKRKPMDIDEPELPGPFRSNQRQQTSSAKKSMDYEDEGPVLRGRGRHISGRAMMDYEDEVKKQKIIRERLKIILFFIYLFFFCLSHHLIIFFFPSFNIFLIRMFLQEEDMKMVKKFLNVVNDPRIVCLFHWTMKCLLKERETLNQLMVVLRKQKARYFYLSYYNPHLITFLFLLFFFAGCIFCPMISFFLNNINFNIIYLFFFLSRMVLNLLLRIIVNWLLILDNWLWLPQEIHLLHL